MWYCPRASALTVAVCLAAADGAWAQDSRAFDLDHLQLAVTSPEFLAMEGVGPVRKWSWQASAAWRFGTAALLADTPGATQRVLVGTRHLLDVGGGAVLWRRFGLGVNLPVLLSQAGTAVAEGSALGDVRLVGRVNAFELHGLRGAVLLGLRLPTGDTTRFLGEGSAVVEPRFALEWSGDLLRVGLNLGARLREERTFGDLRVGHEVFAALGLGVRPIRYLDLFGEAHVDTALAATAFQSAVTPVELLAGAAGLLRGFRVQAAVGFGVVEGFGNPSVRVLAALSYATEPPPPVRAVAAPIPPPPPPAPPPPPPPKLAEEKVEEEEEEEVFEAPSPKEEDVRVGRATIVLADPVYFITDKARVRMRFHRELRQLAHALLARPWIKVLWIEGHTDATGPRRWNERLSHLRAQRVTGFLVMSGVPAHRVRPVGRGQNQPWFSNHRPAGRERNRRVTFFIERGPTPPAVADSARAEAAGAAASPGAPSPPPAPPEPRSTAEVSP